MSKRVTLGFRDELFAHLAEDETNSDTFSTAPDIRWSRDGSPQRITVFTDKNLDDVYIDPSPVKIAWLLETPEFHPDTYEAILDHQLAQRFDAICTWYEPLLKLAPRFVFAPFGGCWIDRQDWIVYPKTENISTIASEKNFLIGHAVRHEVIRRYGNRFDAVYGRGYNPIDKKIDGLRSFRYSVTIENAKLDYWFTEKLIDCFATGTVPIYWGCPSIGRFFNTDGMILFDSIDELEGILSTLSAEDYERRRPAIEDNFQRFRQYASAENYLLNMILRPRYSWLSVE